MRGLVEISCGGTAAFGDRYKIAAMDMARPWGWPKSPNYRREISTRSLAAS
jgi:hypothetical protein